MMDMPSPEYERKVEFERLTRPVIEYLNRKGHPHMKVIIDVTSAELVEGKQGYTTEDYLPD